MKLLCVLRSESMGVGKSQILFFMCLGLYLHMTTARIDDFIIKNENDLRRLEAANEMTESEENEDDMYDSCGGDMSVGDYSPYSMMDQDASNGDMVDMSMVQMALNQLKNDPRYMELFSQFSSDSCGNPEITTGDHVERNGISQSCNILDSYQYNGIPLTEEVFNML